MLLLILQFLNDIDKHVPEHKTILESCLKIIKL